MVIDKKFIDTGLSRRMDDLGRVVIPKDVRRKLRISSQEEDSGDVQWSIFISEDGDVLLRRI